ncbi:MAG: carboxymuconolactone decarboxylase family protein [Pirellulaceae bacterium]
MQGESPNVANQVASGQLETAGLSDADRKLLDFAKLVTERAASCTAADVQVLRDVGWLDKQIAEAVYVVAMFAFFNRVADAFGIESEGLGDV